jgi:OmpA-OmpF porin, OOP family
MRLVVALVALGALAIAGPARAAARDRDGDTIPDDRDRCPDAPEDLDGFEDEDGCPDPDNDRDKVPDVDDLCPNDAEDRDGFEDEDGCPDVDNDKDRILDRDDKCPNEPETYNGFEDDDGCPDKGRVVVTYGCGDGIIDHIFFRRHSAEIVIYSRPILDAIAATLKGNPQILLVEVSGHTDATERDAASLSAARARAVRDALIALGVSPDRLSLGAYGASRPLDRKRSEKALRKNRRVDFEIKRRPSDDRDGPVAPN